MRGVGSRTFLPLSALAILMVVGGAASKTGAASPVTVTSIGPVNIWVGLTNSDDVGIRFDLKAEIYRNSTTLLGSGELASVQGGSSGFNNAHVQTIALTKVAGASLTAGDTLSLKVYVRNACANSGKNSGRMRLWYDDAAANSRMSVDAGGSQTYYLHRAAALDTTVGAGPKQTIDTQAGAKCSPYVTVGTWAGAAIVPVTSDTTPPAVTITQPTAGVFTNATTLTVTGGVVEDNAVTVAVNGVAATVSGTAPNRTYSASVPIGAGPTATLQAVATDAAGNVGQASVTVNVDRTAPSVQITAPAAAAFLRGPTVTVSGTVSDATATTVTVNNVATPITAGSFTATIPVADGAATLRAVATDAAGNTSTSQVAVTVDSVAPVVTVSLSPPPNANGWNNTPVTVHFGCTDPGSGIVTCPADQIVSTDGSNQLIQGSATDRAGNTTPASVVVNIDTVPPVLTLDTPADSLTLFTSPVAASGTAIDSLSGVASVTCNGAAATMTDTQVACTVALTPGSNTLTATVTDRAGNNASAVRALQYTKIPVVTITAPATLEYLNISPTTVTGTVDDPEATVAINSIPAVVANGVFTLALPLAEGPNIITASASTPSGGTSTASVTVTLDTTPPHVTITSPADTFVTADSTVAIAGNINDIVVGTVNDTEAQVTVNGVPAQVANRMFLATNVPLAVGPNVIQAVGRDRVGNAATTQITVTRQPAADRHISLFAGNNQTGAIGTTVSQPLVVTLSDAAGAPVPNASVIFKVTQNDGLVGVGGVTPAPTTIVTTDGDGHAAVRWTLGHRAGAGGNGVEAYAVGYDGTAVFTATGTQGPAGKIVIDTGNDQIGAIGQSLPKPFIAVVVDDGNNRLGGVPVTFSVAGGGGSLDGQETATVNTDSDGRAAVTLTLGMQEGNANNIVQATFPSNSGLAAAFTASGRAPGNPEKTTVTGVVLDNSNAPIPGVIVRAVLTNELHSNAAAVQNAVADQTNAQGQFVIPAAPVGLVKLLVDGSTAQRPGVFPSLEYDIVTVAGQNNNVGQPIYLLPLDTTNQLCVTATTGGGTLTMPDAPGFSLTFGPGQVTFPGGSKEGCVSVTVVHGDKVPMVPGFGQQPRFIVTIQPAGAVFNPPAPMTLPNVDGLRPREVTEMYSFDHDIGSFVAIGTGTVSDDGLVIRTNTGVGVLKAGWHCGGNPSPTGTAANCAQCQKCDGTTCVADNSASCDDGKFCTSGDGKNPGADKCDGGSCKGKEIEGEVQLKVEVDAAKIASIKENLKKISEIATTATKWMPCWVGHIEPEISASEEKGKFCCEEDKKMLDGNRISGGGGGSISAGCFIGLTSLAPELPPNLIAALGVQADATLSLTGKVSDVLNSCTGPQWNETGDLGLKVQVSAVFVKVGDIVGAKLEGPNAEGKIGFKAENLFSNFHFTGSLCVDGEVKMVVEHFGVKLEILTFSLFEKKCIQ